MESWLEGHVEGGSENFVGESWEDEVAQRIAARGGEPMDFLPRGLRYRSSKPKQSTDGSSISDPKRNVSQSSRLEHWLTPERREFLFIAALTVTSFVSCGYFGLKQMDMLPQTSAWDNQACQQCRHEWWDDFWHWRLTGAGVNAPSPPGLVWDFNVEANYSDWYNASSELVDSVIRDSVDKNLGPVLQIGCGDSPLPELMYNAGFNNSLHIDVAAQIINAMKDRYPARDWPGLNFEVRDFLNKGSPPPSHRFSAVVDKAGIWDWLQEEASWMLAQLLSDVRDALVLPPQQGVYIIATRLAPVAMSKALAQVAGGDGANFAVESTRPLGTKGIAWAYVLAPL